MHKTFAEEGANSKSQQVDDAVTSFICVRLPLRGMWPSRANE